MTDAGTISTYESGVDLVVEWKIENFFNLPERDGKGYSSPDFSFGGERWWLRIFPNGSSGSDSSGHVDLVLWKYYSAHSIKQSFSLSLKTAKGEKYNEQNVTKDFDKWNDCHSFNRFTSRSDLTRRNYELVPDGVLTVVCTMKSSTSDGSASNTASTCDKCCHCKEAFDAESLSSHQKRCMHRPTKCPDCLEVVVLQKWLDEHECQREGSERKSREENSKSTCVEAYTQTERENDYNCCGKLLTVFCIASILIIIMACGDLVVSNEQLQEKTAQLEAVAETLKARESELNAIKKEHGEFQNTCYNIVREKNKLKHCLDSEKQNLVISNEQLQEKIAQLKAVSETLKARESELYAIKKEHGELHWFSESIASKKNKLEQNLVQLKKEMEEKQSKIDSITKELRKKETDFNDFKKTNEKLILKIKEIESEKKCLEEKATENKKAVKKIQTSENNKANNRSDVVGSNEFEASSSIETSTTDIKKWEGINKTLAAEMNKIDKSEIAGSDIIEASAAIRIETDESEPLLQPVLMVTEVCSTYLEVAWDLPDESKTNAAHIHYIVHFRKYGTQWQEVSFLNASRTSYSLTNLNPGMSYQIYVMAVDSRFSRPSEIATVRTSDKVVNHSPSKGHGKQLLVYAATIIILVIAIACVYDYSKTSFSALYPYGEGTQTISAEEDNNIKAGRSEVAETDEPQASDSKRCATETEGPVTFNNVLEDCGFVTDINHLLKENRGIDVTFELETPSGETKLFAHQLILAVMSSYFADEFYDKGRNKGHQVVPLKRIDPKAFEQMIRYCYGENPIFKTTEEVYVLFKIASKFKVISLQNLCHTFFSHTKIEPGNVFSILKISVEMEDKSLKDMCYQVLQEKTREVMTAYELCDITPAMVYTLLKLPKLSLNSEYDLIKWIFEWAKVKSGDAREYLERLLKDMNFLALRFEEFATLCKDYQGFFNSNEIASIYQNIAHAGTREMPEWFNNDLKCRVYTRSNE